MSVTAVKVGVGFAAAVVLFQAITAQVVMNAIMLFVTAGVVPGTDIALSPDATIVTVIATLIGIVVLWNRKRIMQGVRHPHQRLEPVVYKELVSARPEPAVRRRTLSFLTPLRPSRIKRAIRVLGLTTRRAGQAVRSGMGVIGWLAASRPMIVRQRLGIFVNRMQYTMRVLQTWENNISLRLYMFWRDRKLGIIIWRTKARALMERLLSE